MSDNNFSETIRGILIEIASDIFYVGTVYNNLAVPIGHEPFTQVLYIKWRKIETHEPPKWSATQKIIDNTYNQINLVKDKTVNRLSKHLTKDNRYQLLSILDTFIKRTIEKADKLKDDYSDLKNCLLAFTFEMKKAKGMLEVTEPEIGKETSKLNAFEWKKSEKTLDALYDKLKGDFIDCDLITFQQAFDGHELKEGEKRIVWTKRTTRGKFVAKKALIDFMRTLAEFGYIDKSEIVHNKNKEGYLFDKLATLFTDTKNTKLKFTHSNTDLDSPYKFWYSEFHNVFTSICEDIA